MKSPYESNLEAMKTNNPMLVQRLSSVSSSQLLKVSEHFINETSAFVQSRLDSERWLILEGCEALVALGASNGVLGKKLFLVEPEMTRLKSALQVVDISRQIEKDDVKFFCNANSTELSSFMLTAALNRYRIAGLISGIFLREPSRFQADERYFAEFEIRFKEALEMLSVLEGFREDGILGMRYLIENQDWICKNPGISALKGIFKGIPALILSTGPSLSKSLPELRQLIDRAILISADASLRVLTESGVVPHFVCSLERELSSLPFFEQIRWESLQDRPNLVAYPVVPKKVLEAFKGPQWVSYRSYRSHAFFESQTPRGRPLRSGHSVAHLSVALAEEMGCSPIVLVGQDLAFDPETLSSHSKGVAYLNWSKEQSLEEVEKGLSAEGDHLYWAAGNLRDKVPTRGFYVVFARQFSAMAQKLTVPLINATDGGLKIPGIEWRPLSEVAVEWARCGNSFDRIRDLRAKLTVSGSFDFKPLLARMNEILLHLSTEQKTFQSLFEQKEKMTEAYLVECLEKGRAFWNQLKDDHVFDGFVCEIIGAKVVRHEVDWYDATDETDTKASVEKRLKLLSDFFSECISVLKEVMSLIPPEKKVH